MPSGEDRSCAFKYLCFDQVCSWLVSRNRWVLCSGIRNGLWLLILGSEGPPLLHPQPTTNDSKNMLYGRVLSFLLFSVILPAIHPGLEGQSAPSLTAVFTVVSYSVCHRGSGQTRQCIGFDMTSHLSFYCPQTSQLCPHNIRDNTESFWWAVDVYSVLKD